MLFAGWSTNPRGAGYFFGIDVLRKFNQRHGLQLVVRSHEMQQKGWSAIGLTQPNGSPSLVTVFSAPNYRQMRNIGERLKHVSCCCFPRVGQHSEKYSPVWAGATMVVSKNLSYKMQEFEPQPDGLSPCASADTQDWSSLLSKSCSGQGPLLGTNDVAEMVSPFAICSERPHNPSAEHGLQARPVHIYCFDNLACSDMRWWCQCILRMVCLKDLGHGNTLKSLKSLKDVPVLMEKQSYALRGHAGASQYRCDEPFCSAGPARGRG